MSNIASPPAKLGVYLRSIKEQYMELMDKQAVKVKSDEAEPEESPAVMAQLSLLPGQTIL